MKVEYCSNNSGGSWWLTEQNWLDLKSAGWEIKTPSLGAIATSAFKDFDTMAEAVREFEKITGLDSTDDGCNCCGPPHSFYSEDMSEYASGQDILPVLYPDKEKKSLRELYEQQ